VEYLKKIYRHFKYGYFVNREKEHINFHRKRRDKLIKNYSENNAIKKLQIGAQSNSIHGWLNVDILPKDHAVAYMDATEKFPISDNAFDYVFSEHMIEHISIDDGEFMMKECYRILKPGGKIRIATPDLEAVVKVFTTPDVPEHKAYIKFYIDRFWNGKYPYDPVYAVNKMFYDFGHRFIHSEHSLTALFKSAGFKNIRKFDIGKSDDPQLQNVEQHAAEIGEANNRLETIVMQAEK
jgi:predicted SAM-dependent methyltransferase